MGFLDKLFGKKKQNTTEESVTSPVQEEATPSAEPETDIAAEEAAQKAAEEAAQKAAEEAAQKAAEEAAQKAAEEAAQKAAEEAAQKAAEEAAKKAAEEAAQKAAEEAAQKAAEEAAQKAAEEAAQKAAEEAAQKAAEEAAQKAAEEAANPKQEKKSFWKRVREGLTKTKSALFGQIDDLLKSFVKVDEELLEELEELLIMSDVGVNATEEIIDRLRDEIKSGRLKEKDQVIDALKSILAEMIGEGGELDLSTTPSIILVIGVNGAGKTTSIGKISNRLIQKGKKVVVAAADTFRAAAIDQLAVWCERSGADIVKQNEGSDPAAVVYDALNYAKKRGADVLIIDTAGRLHNKTNLMNELAKINRVIDKEC
ncbi:MAG: signal recognition particle receptor subunit alpha, partial [Clostridia bacterium]|nr:signal recognition particle receptor subunit alpha [Clostridia bacterium]